MLITNIVGGLGNQMFQYACGRALGLDLSLPLKVTQDMFGVYRSHYGPEIERVFSLSLEVAQPDELAQMIGWLRTSPRIRRALVSKVLAPLRGKNFVVEPHSAYWEGLRDRLQYGGYIQGYWQNERYFSAHSAIIRSDFTFKRPLTDFNASTAKAIRNSAAVSVHIRRGDYVNVPKTLAWHGICQPEYYLRAIEVLRNRVSGARFYVFSDDLKWVADVLVPSNPDLILIDQNRGESSYVDMHLMSLCQHHIIANSSFSWWGAWLNAEPNKIVIAPRLWLANGTDSRAFIPSTWEQM